MFFYMLLALALAGFGFACFRFGAERALCLPFWRSFGYGPRASFLRGVSKKTGVTLLDVTPARPPLRFIVVMGGVTIALQILAAKLGRTIGGEGAVLLLGNLMAAALVVTVWLPFARADPPPPHAHRRVARGHPAGGRRVSPRARHRAGLCARGDRRAAKPDAAE